MSRGETDWQALISDTATRQFALTGRILNFRLARGDLAALAGQVMKQDPALLRKQWEEGQGFLGLRCLVHCAPLGKAIAVDEWVKSPALEMAQAARRVNYDIVKAERRL